jgi:bla regulator protein blaR1
MMLALGKHLLESTIFALFVGILTFIFHRRGPATRHLLWLLAAANFLLPSRIISLLGSRLAQLLPARHVSQAIPGLLTRWVAPATISLPPQTENPSLLSSLLLLVWLLGCAVMLSTWLPKLWSAPGCSDSVDGVLQQCVQRLAQRLGLRQPVTLRFSDSISEPVLFGFRKPVAVLPTGLAGKLSSEELESVILHELAHAKRKDNWAAAFSHVVSCIFWFYPIVWWIEQRLHRECEFACDEMVVCYGAAPDDYAAGILKICHLQLSEDVAGVSGVCGLKLKDRMEAIMSFSVESFLRPIPKTLVGALVAAAFLIPMVFGFFAPGTYGQATSPLELTVTRVDKAVSGRGPHLHLDIQNVSQKCVIGFVINKRFANADDKTIMNGTETSVRLSKDGDFKCLAPGEVDNFKDVVLPTNGSGKPAAKYAFTVDYVVFSDQSTWGPGRDRYEDGRVDGMIQLQRMKDNHETR